MNSILASYGRGALIAFISLMNHRYKYTNIFRCKLLLWEKLWISYWRKRVNAALYLYVVYLWPSSWSCDILSLHPAEQYSSAACGGAGQDPGIPPDQWPGSEVTLFCIAANSRNSGGNNSGAKLTFYHCRPPHFFFFFFCECWRVVSLEMMCMCLHCPPASDQIISVHKPNTCMYLVKIWRYPSAGQISVKLKKINKCLNLFILSQASEVLLPAGQVQSHCCRHQQPNTSSHITSLGWGSTTCPWTGHCR